MIDKAKADLAAQVVPDSRPAREMLRRYPKAKVAKFDGKADTQPTELDALVAYCRCWARWSISRPSTRPARTHDKGASHVL